MEKHIFLIAGEASGDNLGSKLMRAIKSETNDKTFFSGIGGEKMEAEGLSSIFPMQELSLLGFVELIPHIPRLLKRIDQTAHAIMSLKPDIVVTIDAPAFNHRVIKKLREHHIDNIPFVHYVAPSVWAYKRERAKKVAQLYDHLLALLPFEAPYFEAEKLDTTFIGHPITESNTLSISSNILAINGFNADYPTLAIMPGSRSGELKRILPVFEKTVSKLAKKYKNIQTIILSTERFEDELVKRTLRWPTKNIVVSSPEDKEVAIAFADIALAKSGTGSVELSLAGLPVVIAYKVNPLSAWMLRRMIQVDFVNLVNIILNREVIPECLQENCNPDFISQHLEKLFDSEEARTIQLEQAEEALIKLGKNQKIPPSLKAAKTILSLITDDISSSSDILKTPELGNVG